MHQAALYLSFVHSYLNVYSIWLITILYVTVSVNTFLYDRKYLGWAQVMSNIIFVNANSTLCNNFLLEMIF